VLPVEAACVCCVPAVPDEYDVPPDDTPPLEAASVPADELLGSGAALVDAAVVCSGAGLGAGDDPPLSDDVPGA
jgi:hypothetical protein